MAVGLQRVPNGMTEEEEAEWEAEWLAARLDLIDAILDHEESIFGRIDTSKPLPDRRPAPMFSVSEVTKCFFGRSPHWLRWLEREGKLVLNRRKVGERRTASGSRCYTLGDIEKIAHALYQQDAIDLAQLRAALFNIRNNAIMWGILPVGR